MVNLVDPADAVNNKKDEQDVKDQEKFVSIDSLTLEDFRAIPESKAAVPHPFDGYPEVKLKSGGKTINATHLIALNPKEEVFQDKSNKIVSTVHHGGKPKSKKDVRIRSYHNRVVPDYDQGGINVDVVFDRVVELADGKTLEHCAFVKSPSVRAQIMFDIDPKTSRITVNRTYLLADSKQVSKLRQVFLIIMNPRLKAERDAQFISQETEEVPEGMEN